MGSHSLIRADVVWSTKRRFMHQVRESVIHDEIVYEPVKCTVPLKRGQYRSQRVVMLGSRLLAHLLVTQPLIEPMAIRIGQGHVGIVLIVDLSFKATVVDTVDERLHIQHQITIIAQ